MSAAVAKPIRLRVEIRDGKLFEKCPVVTRSRGADARLIGSLSKTDVILALAGSNRAGTTTEADRRA